MLYIYDETNPEHIRAMNEWGQHVSGRGWLTITGMTLGNLEPRERAWIESMQFEVELSFTGALNLWQLPSRYIIPKRYTGWVRVYREEKGAPPSPKSGLSYVVRIPASGVLHTSSELRSDDRDARYVFSDGTPIPTSGLEQQIWAWTSVDAGDCGTYHIFFVGTKGQYDRAPKDKDGGPPFMPCRSDRRP